MIIYNITTKVHHNIAADWLQWMKDIHIPEIMQTESFTAFKILKLLEVDEEEGPTFAVQFFADSKALYNRYIDRHSAEMKQRSFEKWGNRFIAYRSVMQIVE